MKSWWRAVISYPPTWIAAVVLGVTVWAMIALFDPPGFLVGVLVGAGLPRCGRVAAHHVGHRHAVAVAVRDPARRGGRSSRARRPAGRTRRAPDSQPAEQLAALQQKRQSLVNVLERRLDAGELTYSRYLATSQQVYNAALHNLHEVALASESISTIDEAYIDRRIAELADDDSDDVAVARERATLEQRRELRTAQRRKIAQLLAQNESALTALDRTTTALADVPIGKRPEDADAAMAALDELADRAAKYAT
jgi:hypothetical protein